MEQKNGKALLKTEILSLKNSFASSTFTSIGDFMNKKRFLALAVCAATLNAFCAGFSAGKTVYVSVKSANLKSGTSSFSKNMEKVFYGNSGTVVQSNSKQTKIQLPSGATGWISNGSLTSKKIVASSGTARISSSELANAGKGFSAEAENAFKSSNTNLDYADVDAMEKITVSDTELQNFITEGRLNGGEE